MLLLWRIIWVTLVVGACAVQAFSLTSRERAIVGRTPSSVYVRQAATNGHEDNTVNFRSAAGRYYSYKTFKKLGVPAILYSTVAKVVAKARRIQPARISLVTDHQSTNDNHQRNKVALITGSNTGVGYETAKQLVLEHGYDVIVACRSTEKGQAACDAINSNVADNDDDDNEYDEDAKKQKRRGNAMFLGPVDLSDLDSVRSFCDVVNRQFTTIDVLVNNAGRNSAGPAVPRGHHPPKKLDQLFTTNFLGHFLLTNLLLDKCQRIVNLSSVMHHFPTYERDDTPGSIAQSTEYWMDQAVEPTSTSNRVRKTYAPSKLAALLFSFELTRRYGTSKGIRSIAVNPGAVNSDIWRNYSSIQKRLFRRLYLTPTQGAMTSVAASVMDWDESVLYLQPYWLPGGTRRSAPPFPLWEMLGPYVGYQPTTPRLPADPVRAAQSLFAVCEELAGCSYENVTNQGEPYNGGDCN